MTWNFLSNIMLYMDPWHSFDFNFGNDCTLQAYSIDPDIRAWHLVKIISSQMKNSPENIDPVIENLAKDMPIIRRFNSLEEILISPVSEEYEAPEKLMPYREMIEKEVKEKGNFNGKKIHNGDILVIKGGLSANEPIKIQKGGFFDFKATELCAIPSLNMPDLYPQGKTVKELISSYGLKIDNLARYLGVAYIMLPKSNEEVGFVQRAKSLGVAPDCMALPGSTPQFDKSFFDKGFNFAGYLRKHIEKEMFEEYRLSSKEFAPGKITLIDDKTSMPFFAVEIITPLSTSQLAKKNYRNKDARKEHPVLYAVKRSEIQKLTENFKLYPSTSYILNRVLLGR